MSAHAAARCAAALAARPWVPPAPSGRAFARTFALGDPQSPNENVFAILDRFGALGSDGMLREDVALISIGDHFDWNGDLAVAQAHGLHFLGWLAEHPPDQVVILAGNHDLRTDGERVVYEMGIQPVAPHEGGLYMIDAEMNSIPVADYPLFELAAIEG